MKHDLTGKKFNKLVAIKEVEHVHLKGRHARWLCKCDCGNEVIVDSNKLVLNRQKSCGCAKKDWGKKRSKIIVINDVSKTLAEWSEISGINKSTIRMRLKKDEKGLSLIRPLERRRLKNT